MAEILAQFYHTTWNKVPKTTTEYINDNKSSYSWWYLFFKDLEIRAKEGDSNALALFSIFTKGMELMIQQKEYDAKEAAILENIKNLKI
jgi:hypothetical protein